MRIGIGFDIHPREKGKGFFLGGIEIPADFKLKGHSDADVLLHAISDAILGAAALGDIGTHFPDTDQRYRGIASSKLYTEVLSLLTRAGYRVQNIDSVIIAERPLLSPFIPRMREKIATLSELEMSAVNIKAKRAEGLGPIGAGEGIAAWSTTMIERLE